MVFGSPRATASSPRPLDGRHDKPPDDFPEERQRTDCHPGRPDLVVSGVGLDPINYVVDVFSHSPGPHWSINAASP